MKDIKTIVSSSPHITAKNSSVRRIMIDVLIALFPCVVVSAVIYGYHVIINLAVCLLFCCGSELLYDLIATGEWTREGVKRSSISDLSFAVTAVILALNLPVVMPVDIWGLNAVNADGVVVFSFDSIILCALGSMFSIMLAKKLFGGIGKNFANPAASGRIFLFIAFGAAGAFNVRAPIIGDTLSYTGATWLTSKQIVTGSMLLDMFLGVTPSSAVGESCVAAILFGYVYLSVRRVIDARIPLITVLSTAIFVFLFDVAPSGASAGQMFAATMAHVLSGGLMFGAVFMATDYSTSPNTFWGSAVFAVGIGLITALIRSFGAFTEGFSFALLIMNIAVPLIDRYIVPKPFGYEKSKKVRSGKGGEQ